MCIKPMYVNVLSLLIFKTIVNRTEVIIMKPKNICITKLNVNVFFFFYFNDVKKIVVIISITYNLT